MNTFLTKEDQSIKAKFEQFAKVKIEPVVAQLANGKTNIDLLLKELASSGHLGITLPAIYGGQDGTLLQAVLLAETLSSCDASLVVYLACHIAACELIKRYGSESQKSAFLCQLAQGTLLGTLSYSKTINNTGVNVTYEGENLLFTGAQEKVVLLPNPDQNLLLTFTDKGFVLINALDSSSIQYVPQALHGGLSALNLFQLNFAKYSCNKNSLLGESIPSSEEAINFGRAIIKTILSAAALGMVETVLKECTEYAKSASRNGEALAKSEAIQWKLADAAADTEAARLLIYRAACSHEESPENFHQYSTMAKTYATRIARQHSSEGLQIILPFLHSADSSLTRFYLDTKMLEILDTTNEEEKILLSQMLGI